MQISIPSLKQSILHTTLPTETKLIIMHSTYLIACDNVSPPLHQVAHKVFVEMSEEFRQQKVSVQLIILMTLFIFLCRKVKFSWNI